MNTGSFNVKAKSTKASDAMLYIHTFCTFAADSSIKNGIEIFENMVIRTYGCSEPASRYLWKDDEEPDLSSSRNGRCWRANKIIFDPSIGGGKAVFAANVATAVVVFAVTVRRR